MVDETRTTPPDAAAPDGAAPDSAPTPASTDRYDAFISYSHDFDLDLAREVQQGLHRLARPWYGRRALHVFRDATGLGLTPHLWESICEALDSSRYFILMASPSSARSEWVGRELSRWLDLRAPEHILIVLSDGTIEWVDDRSDFDWDVTDSLHPVLQGVFRSEPLYLDLRWARTAPDLSLREPRFRSQIAELAAPIHGRAPDDLQGEDLRQQQKLRRATRGAVSVLVALLVVAVVTSVIAFQQRSAARHQASVAQARALSAEVLNEQATGRSGLAMLLAVTSDRANSGLPSQSALLHALESPSGLQRDVVMRSGGVGNTAFGADSALVAAGDGNRIRVFRTGSGHELASVAVAKSRHPGSFSFADGDRLLVGQEYSDEYSENTHVRVWRVGRQTGGHELAIPSDYDVWQLATSAHAPVVVALDYYGTTIDVWDADRGRLEHTIATGFGSDEEQSAGLALSPSGKVVASAHIVPVTDGAKQYMEVVKVWDVGGEAPRFECSGPVGGVYDGYYTMYPDIPQMLDVHVDDGATSVTTGASGGRRAILATCRPGAPGLDVATLDVPTARTAPVAGISPDGTEIATRDTNTGVVHVYRPPGQYDDAAVEVRTSVVEPPLTPGDSSPVEFSTDGMYFTLPGSAVDELQVWRARPGDDRLARRVRVPKDDRLLGVAPGARYLFVQTQTGDQRVLDRRTGKSFEVAVPGSSAKPGACKLDPDVVFARAGDDVAVEQFDRACNSTAVALWHFPQATRRVFTIPKACQWSGHFGISGDARVVVVSCQDPSSTSIASNRIARVDISQRRARLLSIDPVGINPDQIAVNHDGTAVVIGETDHAGAAFQAFKLRGAHLARGPVDHANGGFIGPATFSPTGDTFATGFTDGRLELWSSPLEGQPAAELATTGSGAVEAIAFSADGSKLVTGDDTRQVKLWDVPTRSLIGVVAQRAGQVEAVTVVDGTHVAAATLGHTYDEAGDPPGAASIISFDAGSLRDAACSIVGRDLSASERARFAISDDGSTCAR